MIRILRRIHHGFLREIKNRKFSSEAEILEKYDVIVIGGGHAGTEACAGSARMGAKTLLVTHKRETIGEMSCNPSFGGIGKGHLIKEVDALDGVCGKCCDISGIQYKILNKRKGPAVWGYRAQIDRKLYKAAVQEYLDKIPNLDICVASVEDIIYEDKEGTNTKKIKGIVLQDGRVIYSKGVVITTGTFLRGEINIGLDVYPAGRIGDEPAIGLAKSLEKLGFTLARLKTGTPPRIKSSSINFKILQPHYGDNPPVPFSFMNRKVWLDTKDQLPCYMSYTSPEVAEIIKNNLHLNKHVTEEINGPRYCPSIESKILRFGEKNHQIWLEPEGFDSDIIYPNGLSCTLPADLQIKLVRCLRGLENAEIVRPGYGVTYDYVDARELYPTLETKKVEGLFLAGQINGTTGYEEAASQGILSGANAAAKALDKDNLIINRTEAYLGVLVNDLTTLGTNEPYRMFTSRAEYRLTLRPDNADLRLTEKGYRIGLVSSERFEHYTKMKENLEKSVELMKDFKLPTNAWREKFGLKQAKNSIIKSAFEMLAVTSDSITIKDIAKLEPKLFNWIAEDDELCRRITIQSVYDFAVQEQAREIEEVKRDEALIIPKDIDYFSKNLSLSYEERGKLAMMQPQTLAAASRIQGITPATIVRLLRHVKQSTVKEIAEN